MVTFKEVMTELLERPPMQKMVGCGSGSPIMLLEDLPEITTRLKECSDTPERAKAFVIKLGEVSSKLGFLVNGNFEAFAEMDEVNALQAIWDMLRDAKQLVAELVEASKVNNSLTKFAEVLQGEVDMLLSAYEGMLSQAQVAEDLLAGLDDLFDDEEEAATDEQKPATS